MGTKNLTLSMIFQLMLFLSFKPGRVLTENNGNDGNSRVSPSLQDDFPVFYCWTRGYFQVPGSCRDFYYCEAPTKGLLPLRLTCPPKTVFRKDLNTCHLVSPLDPVRPECNGESFIKTESVSVGSRLKRFAEINTILNGLPSLTRLVKGSVKKGRIILPDLTDNEHRLSGMDARLKNIDLQSFLDRLANKTKADITQILMSGGMGNYQFNSKKLRDLVSLGILETRLRSAITQGLLRQQNIARDLNFNKLHASIGDINDVIAEEINKVHSEFKMGYNSISHTVNQSVIKQLLSDLLTTVKNFNERTNLLHSLSESDFKDEIERNGGYIEFLESSSPTIKNKLYDVIYQKLALPKNASDNTSLLVLQLIFEGLQAHKSLLSSIILSNVYLAGKALEEKELQNFNNYISRVSRASIKMKRELGNRNTNGLIKEVKHLLHEIQQLPFVSSIKRFPDFTKYNAVLTDLESDIDDFVTSNTPMEEPGQIQNMPQFYMSNASLPIGSWKTGNKVQYAIQFVSDNRLSKIGEWSQPYTVTDRANPIIHLPRVESGVTRVLYRQFLEEAPEIVAFVPDENDIIIRDTRRDIINAAARLNYDLAVDEISDLITDEADVNITLENDMTPLHYAAKSGNLLAMQLLLNASADIHAKTLDNEGVLHLATLSGNEEAVSYIINKGANINTQTKQLEWSPLHIAVANSYAGIVQLLIENEAFVNIKDNRGLTPLHLSVLGNGETMEILLKLDTVDVNAKADGDLTSLHYAVQSSNVYHTKRLLKHNDTEVNSVTDHHFSPLHYAAMNGNEIIEDLIYSGASVLLKDNYGSSPLHYAAFYGNKEAALILSKNFPNLKAIKNNDGKTAFDLAVENDREEIIQILRNETEYLINLIKEELARSQADQSESNGKTSNQSTLPVDNPSLQIHECTQLKVKELGILSEETCLSVGQIADYVRAVTANIPLSVHYDMPPELSGIIESYNHDIQEAKRNANIWRNQNSIRGDIQQTFKTAKEFEATFNMKYDILIGRLASITRNMDKEKITAELREEKSKLERKLQETEEVLLEATSLNVKRYLQQTVSRLQQDIENKQSQISTDPSLIYKLLEFVDFLSIVRDDASGIKQQATTTKQRIFEFKEKLKKDRTKFEYHNLSIQNSLKVLQEQSVSYNSELVSIQQRQEELEREIRNQKERRLEIYSQTLNIFSDMRNKRRELIQKIGNMRFKESLQIIMKSVAKKLKQIILTMSGIPVDLIDPPLLEVADSTDKQLIEDWQNTIKSNKIETEKLAKSLEINEQLLADFRRTIANDSLHSETLTKKLNTLNRLSDDLQSILTDIPSPEFSILTALSGVMEVEELFSKINQELSDMISKGQTNGLKESALSSIRNKLPELQCYWKDAGLYIVNFGECS